MKRTTIVICITLLVITFLIPIGFAIAAGGFGFVGVRDVLGENSGDARREMLNPTMHKNGMNFFLIAGEGMVEILPNLNRDLPFEERIEKGRGDDARGTYISMGTIPFYIRYATDIESGERYVSLLDGDSFYGFVRNKVARDFWVWELKQASAVQVICGELCVIEDVVFLGGKYLSSEMLLITNKGNFIRNYGNPNLITARYEMTEEDYIHYYEKAREEYENTDPLNRQTGPISPVNGMSEEERAMYLQKSSFFLPVWVHRLYGFLWIFAAVTFYVIWRKHKEQLAVAPPTEDTPPPDEN